MVKAQDGQFWELLVLLETSLRDCKGGHFSLPHRGSGLLLASYGWGLSPALLLYSAQAGAQQNKAQHISPVGPAEVRVLLAWFISTAPICVCCCSAFVPLGS